MNYFLLDISYLGPTDGWPDDTPKSIKAQEANWKVEKEFAEKLKDFQLMHSYSWPDGSLYYWIRTDLDKKELDKELKERFESSKLIHSIYISDVDPEKKSHKFIPDDSGEYRDASVRELFEAHYIP